MIETNLNNILNIKDCTACFACVDICPQKCIRIGETESLEEKLIIDDEACVHCGSCLSVCQVYRGSDDLLHDVIDCYAVQSKENDIKRIQYSSGGLASVLSRYIIRNGGLVASTVWNGQHEAKFVLVDDESQLQKCVGSKYVHSDASSMYRQIIEMMQTGKKILFVGLPCQVAGLKRFISRYKENVDVSLLYTVDLVCHGTPPTSYLQEYIDHYLKQEKVDDIKFRGERDFCLTLKKGKNVIYSQPADRDAYFRAFLDGTFYRDNCYQCKYARPERTGDITVGDFWGLGVKEIRKHFNGRVSLCLVNTQKGQGLFNKVKDNLNYEKRDFSEALSENKQLTAPVPKGSEVENFKKNISHFGFPGALKRTESYIKVKRNIKLYRKQKLINIAKNILGMK